jgi:helix-turn-helix protein
MLAPATSLARLRKQVLDLAMSGRMKATEACGSLGISRSRFYELRKRYLTYGEAGLLPKPRPAARPDRRLAAPLADQIIAYAIHHPTEGPRTIAVALHLPRFGAWRVSHGGVSNVLGRAGLSRMSARLAAAESLSAAEGGPITERALRDLRAQEVAHRHIGSAVLGEQVFVDTMFVGRLKGVGKITQGQCVCRAFGEDTASRSPRLDADPRTPPPRPGSRELRQPLQLPATSPRD